MLRRDACCAWDWIDEASACIFAVSQRLANTIDRIDLEILKAHHKFMLRNALAADRVPLELPQEACEQYIVEGSKRNLKKIFSKVPGLRLHSKHKSKLFVHNASTIQGLFLLYALTSLQLPSLHLFYMRDSMCFCASQVLRLAHWSKIRGLYSSSDIKNGARPTCFFAACAHIW